jgi:CheY-like chemotaxis protein
VTTQTSFEVDISRAPFKLESLPDFASATFYAAGMDGYISKPIRTQEMFNTIEALRHKYLAPVHAEST